MYPDSKKQRNMYTTRLIYFCMTYKIFLINLREYQSYTIISTNIYSFQAYAQEEGRNTKIIRLYLGFEESET